MWTRPLCVTDYLCKVQKQMLEPSVQISDFDGPDELTWPTARDRIYVAAGDAVYKMLLP